MCVIGWCVGMIVCVCGCVCVEYCVLVVHIGCAGGMLCVCLVWFSVFVFFACLDVVLFSIVEALFGCVWCVCGRCVVSFCMFGCMLVLV